MKRDELGARWRRARERVAESPLPARIGQLVFGDRRGLALFLGSLCYIALLTRVGIFITDTYTTANAFVALTDGHLAIEEAFYGASLDTPGMHVVNGQYYGRNYGQLVLSLPAYWLLEAIGLVADLRIALAGAWSLLLLAFSTVVGRLLDRRRAFTLGGSAFALVAFLGNVAVATPIPGRIVPVLAMQLTSVLAGALLVVVTYRLLALVTSRRAGVVGGVLVVLATPIGFWAPIPKRHVFTTLLVMLALFAFALSRDSDTTRRDLVHGGAYAATGLLAWIHAPEALVLFTTLVVVDLVTSPLDRYRAIPTVAGVFLVSLIPFFVTNYLIAGHPLVPPRLLKTADITAIGADGGGTGGGGTGGGGTGGGSPGGGGTGPTPDPSTGNGSSSGSGGPGLLTVLGRLFDAVVAAITVFVRLLEEGLDTMRNQSRQLYQTFVRSGYVSSNAAASDEPINLSILESAPVLGALVALPLVTLLHQSKSRVTLDRLRQPAPATALASGLFAALFAVLYAERLPLHAQVTVRYLLPLYVVGVVGVVWLAPVERASRAHVRTFTWTVAGGVLLGGQLLTVFVIGTDLALGEAFQFHALLGLGLATVLGVLTLGSAVTGRLDRLVVAAVGLTDAASAVFSLLVVTAYATGLGKYPVDGSQLLPIVRMVADLLGAA